MPNMNRKMVDRDQGFTDWDGCTLKQIQGYIADLILQYGDDAYVKYVQDPYSDDKYQHVFSVEPETDEEMAKRIAQEMKWENEAAKRELRQYQMLQAKFDPQYAKHLKGNDESTSIDGSVVSA